MPADSPKGRPAVAAASSSSPVKRLSVALDRLPSLAFIRFTLLLLQSPLHTAFPVLTRTFTTLPEPTRATAVRFGHVSGHPQSLAATTRRTCQKTHQPILRIACTKSQLWVN